MKKLIFLGFSLLLLACLSCKKKGCNDPLATNYNASAEKDDGSCIYESGGSLAIERFSYGPNSRQHFDLYLPYDHDEETKIVILIHGGAWVLGPLAEDSVIIFGPASINLTNTLLNEGYGVALVKYRLACYTENEVNLSGDPVSMITPMLEDLDLAFNVLKSNAAVKGYNASNFAMIGESAGAHLALLYGFRSTDPALKTIVSFYGPTLMDEELFKINANNAPYINFSVNSYFALSDELLSCEMRETGTMNIGWALNTLAGKKLTVGTMNPEFTDTISPAYPPNLIRNIPTFLMHGSSDNLVPPGHSDSLLMALNNKFGTSPAEESDFTAQHKLKKYASCGHGWSGGSCNKALIRSDLLKWLNAHL